MKFINLTQNNQYSTIIFLLFRITYVNCDNMWTRKMFKPILMLELDVSDSNASIKFVGLYYSTQMRTKLTTILGGSLRR